MSMRWDALKTRIMVEWEMKCLGHHDLREYLREARFGRGLSRDAIARELTQMALDRGHRGVRVAPSTVGNAMLRLGLVARRKYVQV